MVGVEDTYYWWLASERESVKDSSRKSEKQHWTEEENTRPFSLLYAKHYTQKTQKPQEEKPCQSNQ